MKLSCENSSKDHAQKHKAVATIDKSRHLEAITQVTRRQSHRH
jgi:hypothetical protein